MQLFGLKTCDRCRAARKALGDVEFIDVRADGVPDAVLSAALAEFGDALINRSSTTWRNLSESERSAEAMALLRAHPTLMKRPLIVAGAKMTLGWTPDVAEVWSEG